jgi:benzoate membrane transport protein
MRIEKGEGIIRGLKDIKFNKDNLSQFFISLVFSLTGTVVIFINTGDKAGFTPNQTISLIAFSYVMSGIISILMSLRYKIPLVSMSSMTSLIILGREFAYYTINEIVCAFAVTSVILIILSYSGIFTNLTNRFPMPILMGMLAGSYMIYGTGIVTGIEDMPLLGFVTICAFLVSPYVFKKVPRQAVAVVVALLFTFILVPVNYTFGDLLFTPKFYWPSFNPSILVNLCLPLLLLTISDILVTFGILKINGYAPPINAMLTFPAISSLVGSVGFAIPATMSGINASILSSPENGSTEKRYVGAVLKSLASIGIGLLASFLVPVLLVLPGPMKNVLAGLAMLSLFFSALEGAFNGKKFKHGAFAAFIVALTGLNILGISSAIWSLVIGLAVSFFMEQDDFRNMTIGNLRKP